MKKVILFVFTAVGFAVLLASCGSAVSEPAPEERTPTELLTGSWYAMEIEIDNESNRETNKVVLTLTPDRYIYHKVEYESDGNIEFRDYWSGEWEADETTITTTTVWWIPLSESVSEEERFSDPTSYEKNYYFTDDGDVVYVHRWNVEVPRHYERFVRHAGLGDITGTYVDERSYSTDDGDDVHDRWTYEISADSFVEQLHRERNGTEIRWRLAGDVAYDRANYYMFVSVTEVEESIDGEPNMYLNPEQFVGHTLRFAYAPTAESDHIAMSRMWDEHDYDPDTNTWSDAEDTPYGWYWVFAKRQ